MCKEVYLPSNSIEDNKFETISEFKWCVDNGGEVEFEYNDTVYNITHPEGRIYICEAFKPETEMICDTAEEVLEYIIEGKKLREIIKDIIVWNRTL